MGEDAAAQFPTPHLRHAVLRDGTAVTIRPIRPEDAQREQAFVRGLSSESRYFRFLNALKELTPEMLERFTHPDPAREIALIALTGTDVDDRSSDALAQIGVARCVRAENGEQGEFAIVVADAFQGKGLGTLLMHALMDSARVAGLKRLEGLVLATNQRMLDLVARLGFEVHTWMDDPRVRRVVKQLV